MTRATSTGVGVYISPSTTSTGFVGGTVINAGDIRGGVGVAGVHLLSIGAVTNQSGGVISGYFGVSIGGDVLLGEYARECP
jgi:hypothetical protein